MSAVVISERRGPIGVLTLNRPDVLNAIDAEVMERFAEVMAAFRADDQVRAVIITGCGRGFSTGADIRALVNASADERDHFMANAHSMMASIEDLPKPVIAAVNGVAAGGGFEMMLACDFSIAVDSARIGLTEIRYGFLPGGGGTQRLPRWVTPSIAKKLIWSGELLSAEQAMSYGLVAKVVSPAELMSETEAAATKLAERSPLSLAWGKRLVNTASAMPLAEGLLAERKANVELLSSPEAIAAINRFVKRGSTS
jgi:enoyl-CoA hydratase/carnithine racemase